MESGRASPFEFACMDDAMTDNRPDPDAAARAIQGRGSAPAWQAEDFLRRLGRRRQDLRDAVGGPRLLAQGVDVVVGIVETHGRVETRAARRAGDSCRQGRRVSRRSCGIRPRRRAGPQPRLILVDELAHTNAAGSRHAKRWQDVEELLAAGIDVYTTVNVQHLESLNDVVGGITGIKVWETVPDRVFDDADEVVLVDLPPDELLQRLKEGKVYLPAQAERAIRNFFRKGNLIALRELALRRTADRVDDADAAVPPRPGDRAGLADARIAAGLRRSGRAVPRSGAQHGAHRRSSSTSTWHAVYVETPRCSACPTRSANASCGCSSSRRIWVRRRRLLPATRGRDNRRVRPHATISLAVVIGRGRRPPACPWRSRPAPTGWPPWRADLDVVQVGLPARTAAAQVPRSPVAGKTRRNTPDLGAICCPRQSACPPRWCGAVAIGISTWPTS